MSFGAVSTAKINGLVLAGAREAELAEFVAVASRDRARAEEYAREHGLEIAHDSYEALLADDRIDAVYISLPNSMHVEWSIRALEAGKHVLCEKPMARSEAEVARAFDAAEAAGRLLSEAFMWRHNPQTHRLQELVAEGAIGDLRHVHAAFSFRLDDTANIRMRPELEGGSLMDVGCYCVSAARLFCGEPERVQAEAVTSNGVDVRFIGLMRFAGDLTASFDCGFDITPRDELELVGSEGSLYCDDPWHCRVPIIEWRRGDGETERIELAPVDSYGLELDDMSRAISDGGEPLLGRADALGQARAIEALYAAAGAGAEITIEVNR